MYSTYSVVIEMTQDMMLLTATWVSTAGHKPQHHDMRNETNDVQLSDKHMSGTEP